MKKRDINSLRSSAAYMEKAYILLTKLMDSCDDLDDDEYDFVRWTRFSLKESMKRLRILARQKEENL